MEQIHLQISTDKGKINIVESMCQFFAYTVESLLFRHLIVQVVYVLLEYVTIRHYGIYQSYVCQNSMTQTGIQPVIYRFVITGV